MQIGRSMGARVTGLANEASLDFVRALGADEALDYRRINLSDLGSFDVILDTVGTRVSIWRRRLDAKGRMVAIVPDPKHPLRSLAYFALSRVYGERRVRYFNAKPDTSVLEELARQVDQGVVRPTVDGVYPLSRVADAYAAFENGGRRGKQIIEING